MSGRKARVALLIIAGLAIVVAFYAGRGKSALADFQVFYTAGERFLAGESLYQAADGHYQFKYLPASAPFLSPWRSCRWAPPNSYG